MAQSAIMTQSVHPKEILMFPLPKLRKVVLAVLLWSPGLCFLQWKLWNAGSDCMADSLGCGLVWSLVAIPVWVGLVRYFLVNTMDSDNDLECFAACVVFFVSGFTSGILGFVAGILAIVLLSTCIILLGIMAVFPARLWEWGRRTRVVTWFGA